MSDPVDVLAVMDAIVLSAERLAAGEVVTCCAATVEVAHQTRAAVAELIERERILLEAVSGAKVDISRQRRFGDDTFNAWRQVSTTVEGDLEAALARVGGAS